MSTSVGVRTSVVLSGPPIDRSTDTLTRLSKSAAFGVPVNTRPWLSEIPDSVVTPVASLISREGASTIRSVMPMNRPRCAESMMMRLSSLPTGQLRVGPDQPRRVGEVDRVHRGLQGCLADERMLDVVGLDLDLAVVLAHRLRDEREPRIATEGSQFSRAAARTERAKPVLGEHGGAEVDDHRGHEHDGQGRAEADQHLSHVDIVAQAGRRSGPDAPQNRPGTPPKR